MIKKLFIFGAGSAGKDILQIIFQVNQVKLTWEVVGFVDSDPKLAKKEILGIPIFKYDDLSISNNYYGICGVMDCELKKRIVNNEIRKKKYKLATIIHPDVMQPSDLKIGPGSVLFSGVKISYNVKIGKCTWIDVNTLLGHDLMVDNYISIMPSAIISGNCKIGSESIIGAGAIIHQNISIGKKCLVGIGTTIIKNIPDNTSITDFQRKIVRNNIRL